MQLGAFRLLTFLQALQLCLSRSTALAGQAKLLQAARGLAAQVATGQCEGSRAALWAASCAASLANPAASNLQKTMQEADLSPAQLLVSATLKPLLLSIGAGQRDCRLFKVRMCLRTFWPGRRRIQRCYDLLIVATERSTVNHFNQCKFESSKLSNKLGQ